eukprot:SAG11_NODE_727_length_7511_cov_6.485159_1_plen_189_part_00
MLVRLQTAQACACATRHAPEICRRGVCDEFPNGVLEFIPMNHRLSFHRIFVLFFTSATYTSIYAPGAYLDLDTTCAPAEGSRQGSQGWRAEAHRKMVLSVSRWLAWNDSPSSVLKEQRTPLFVEFGFHPRRPIDFLDGVPREERVEDIPERVARMQAIHENIHETIAQAREDMRVNAVYVSCAPRPTI